MHKLVTGVVCFFLSCYVLYAEHAVIKVSMNSDSLNRGSWHTVTWDYIDIEDVESFDLSIPTTIIIPVHATRGMCSYQIGMQIPLPHDGAWKVKLIVNGSSMPSLPFVGQEQNDSIGLQVLSAKGPWFVIGPDEIFTSGSSLMLEVFVDGKGSGPYVDSRSWLQCEWIVSSIFTDDFESGTASDWN